MFCVTQWVISISYWTDVFVDMRDSLGSWSRSTIDTGELKDLPKSAVNGDIYEQAHALAEYQIAQPAIEWLDATHERIADRCWWNLEAKHVTRVFEELEQWKDLDALLSSRKIVDDVKQYDFSESCVEIVKCYFEEQFEAEEIDLEEYDAYTTATLATCANIVTRIYWVMHLEAYTDQVHKNNNYWDEIFANGTHNEKPSEITFYDHDPYDFENPDNFAYDPDILEEHKTQDILEQTNEERLPITSDHHHDEHNDDMIDESLHLVDLSKMNYVKNLFLTSKSKKMC